MSALTIWHNPRCSKSRQALALLQDRGLAPVIRKYLVDPPDRDTLIAVLALLGVRPLDMMRVKEKRFQELGLSPDSDDATLIAAMADNPVLIERPIVITGGRAIIARPPERALELL